MTARGIEKTTLLVKRITNILEEGIGVTGEVAHFIETTFGPLTAAALAQILSDTENIEAESLVELLLYPDEAIQVAMEPLLEKDQYTDKDIDAVIALLTSTPMCITLRVPDAAEGCTGEIVINVTASVLNTLIKRLNITRWIDPRVAGILAHRLADKSEILKARVKLRNARFAFTETATGFLCELIEQTHKTPAFFRQAFTFMVDFLDETDPRADLYSALVEKKYGLRRMIRQAMTTEKALQENPPEVIMLRGDPIFCINVDDTRSRMELIDRVCMLVFGAADASINSDPVALSASIGGKGGSAAMPPS